MKGRRRRGEKERDEGRKKCGVMREEEIKREISR